MATVYLAGQPVDLEDLPASVQQQIRAAQAEVGDTEAEEDTARRELQQAKTRDQIRLAELRLETARERRQAAQESLRLRTEAASRQAEAQAEAAERRDAARRATLDRQEELRREREARQAAERRQRQTQARAQAASRQRGSAAVGVGSHGALSTSVLPESKDTRFLDAGIVAGVAAATSLWTATRTTAVSQYGWGLFWMGLGGLMAVEGRGSLLKYGGFGLLGANAAYLALRTLEPNLTAALSQQPSASGGYVRVGSVMVPVTAPAA